MTLQTREQTKQAYVERINKVIYFINNHLDEDMDLESLASMGNYSVFHFHRIMKSFLGESLGAYIVRVRLETAAHFLRLSPIPVNEIAMKVGYENPASFNKAFKKRFGISPLEYRDDKTKEIELMNLQLKTLTMEHLKSKPVIKEVKDKKVIYVHCLGAYNESAKTAWDKVCDFAAKKKLYGFKTEFIGISYDDPNVTEASKLRYEACISVNKEVQPEGEVGSKTIKGGKYAIFTHKGPYEKFIESYNYIYGKWVPESGTELRDEPCFEKYLNSPDKTKPEKLLTEIYIPVK